MITNSLRLLKIVFHFRKPRPEYHSIEQIFQRISREVRDSHTNWDVVNGIGLYSRINVISVCRNIQHARSLSGDVNHITGDVHYLALGLPAEKTILTIHDCVLLDRNRNRSIRLMIFKFFWYYLPIRRAAIVTTVSEKTRQELIQYVGRLAYKVIVIPNSYDPCFTYKPKPFNTRRPTLLQIGTGLNKNVDRLIEAIEGLACQLIIVGKLTDKQQENLLKYNVEYVQYLVISQEEIVQLYEQSDIVTFVSLYEGFGMPVLEAQVVGRAVITSDSTPMIEVGGAGACYVKPTDVADIRRGILRIWHDDEYRNELIQAGQDNSKKYAVEKITASYFGLYESIIKSEPFAGTLLNPT
jgi:glycosyltransferase involved in cell wall biosynthesis